MARHRRKRRLSYRLLFVCAATFERVPAVELKEQAENSQGIVADKCTVCRQTDACAAVATKEWCERRCQTEHTCTGFYVTDDGGCCIVKSRPQVTLPP